jgi:hypothetical protein
MPRHPSVPGNQTGWIRLGIATTETGLLAIVSPENAGSLGDDWTSRHIGEDVEELSEHAEHELPEFQELVSEGDSAVLFSTHEDGGYFVEGRFGDFMGGTTLIEVRLRLWACGCRCHDGEPAEVKCEGDCHDDDPW